MSVPRNNDLILVFTVSVLACIGLLSCYEFAKNFSEGLVIQTPTDMRLVIPKIDVDAPLVEVGLTAEGAMAAPKDPGEAGWLGQSSIPGRNGSAVIDGHRGWIGHIDAVFDRLHELNPGDRIFVVDGRGTKISFSVRKIRMYDPQDDTKEIFTSESGSHLNLITCEGDWDPDEQSYTKRLVVFAEKD